MGSRRTRPGKYGTTIDIDNRVRNHAVVEAEKNVENPILLAEQTRETRFVPTSAEVDATACKAPDDHSFGLTYGQQVRLGPLAGTWMFWAWHDGHLWFVNAVTHEEIKVRPDRFKELRKQAGDE